MLGCSLYKCTSPAALSDLSLFRTVPTTLPDLGYEFTRKRIYTKYLCYKVISKALLMCRSIEGTIANYHFILIKFEK